MSKQEAIRNAEKEIENIWKAIELLEALPEFEGVEYSTSTNCLSSTVFANLPYDWNVYKQFRRLIGRGWRGGNWCDTQHHDDTVHHHQSLTHQDFEADLNISLCSEMEGSTCKRVQIGTKEVPVYEVTCGN